MIVMRTYTVGGKEAAYYNDRKGTCHFVINGDPFPPGIPANEDIPRAEMRAAAMHAQAMQRRCYVKPSSGFTAGFWMALMAPPEPAPSNIEQWAGWLAYHLQITEETVTS